MKKLIVLLSLLSSLNLWAHCPIDFSAVGLCAELQWMHGPVVNEKSEFQVKFWEKGDHTHTYITPEQDVKIFTWMTMDNGMNHGGPALTVNEVETGVFEVLDARFFMHGMSGYWEVKIELQDMNRNSITKAVKVDLDGNGNGGGHHHHH